ncbi:MAG: MFS transporter, partial [Vampirovibrionia bacterium]
MNESNITTDKSQQYWIIASICFGSLIVTLDNYIVNISLPSISQTFNVSTSTVSLVTMVYLLVLTSCLITCGKLGDKFGLKNIFVLGYTIFTLGSLLCGLAPDIIVLIIARSIQAVGGAMLYALTFAIIPEFLPKNINGKAFGVLSAFSGLGMTLGAPLGGIITQYLSWNWVFLINVPIGIIAIIVSYIVLPQQKPSTRQKNVQFDIKGAVILFVCLSMLFFVLNMGDELGWNSLIIIGSIFVFFVMLISFILWEYKFDHPLIDFALFKDKRFTFASFANVLAFILLAGNNFLIPFYLVMIKGLKIDQAGFVILVYSVVYLVICPFMGRFSDKIKPTYLAAFGMFGCMISSVFLLFTLNSSGLLYIIIYCVLLGISYACFMSPNNNYISNIAPVEKRATGTAYFKTISNLSQVLGVCLFEMLFSYGLNINKENIGKSIMDLHINH